MRCVRIFFTKTGPAKYISHLDLMRFMTRAVRRAGIPLWYTQGFNPRPYLAFALPLSLGTESVCEAMDLRIEGEMPEEELAARLQTALPEGIAITRIGPPELDGKEIARAAYSVRLTFAREERALRFAGHARDLLGGPQLIVMKRGKSGRRKVEKPVDLLPHIHAYALQTQGDTVRLSLCLSAGCNENINPSLLLEALTQPPEFQPEAVSIRRERLLTKDGAAWK